MAFQNVSRRAAVPFHHAYASVRSTQADDLRIYRRWIHVTDVPGDREDVIFTSSAGVRLTFEAPSATVRVLGASVLFPSSVRAREDDLHTSRGYDYRKARMSETDRLHEALGNATIGRKHVVVHGHHNFHA
jgi:hypothetical protein